MQVRNSRLREVTPLVQAHVTSQRRGQDLNRGLWQASLVQAQLERKRDHEEYRSEWPLGQTSFNQPEPTPPTEGLGSPDPGVSTAGELQAEYLCHLPRWPAQVPSLP